MGNIRANRAFMLFFLALVIGAVLLNTISTLIDDWLTETFFPTGHNWAGVLVGLLVLLVLSYIATRFFANRAGKILGAEVITVRADRQEPLPFLLMGYSPLAQVDAVMEELQVLRAENVALPSAAFSAACEAVGRKAVQGNVWQQNLRAAWHHREKLIAVYILNPDKDQFAEIEKYLRLALNEVRPNLEIIQIDDVRSRSRASFAAYDAAGRIIPGTYENYTYSYEGLRRGVDMVHARGDIAKLTGEPKPGFLAWLFGRDQSDKIDRLICVDATAGLKIFSVAAAALTLNRPLKFSYVTSGATGGELRFYDTNLKIAASGGS
jgi:hypothetical protein